MELDVKAILNEDAKTKLIEKREPSFYGGKPTGHNIEYYIGRTRVTIRQGIVHSEVPVFGPISEEIEPYTALFMGEGVVDTKIVGKRRLGKYVLPDDKEVVCVVDPNPYSGEKLKLTISGSSRDKVVELYGLIRDGKIMPEEEFGGVQGGTTREQLEQQIQFLQDHKTGLEAEKDLTEEELCQARMALKEGQALVDRISEERDEARRDLEQARQELAKRKQQEDDLALAWTRLHAARKLAVDLHDESWLCIRSRVADRLLSVLNDAPTKTVR